MLAGARIHFDADDAASPLANHTSTHGQAYFEQLRRQLRWRLLVAHIVPLVLVLAYFHVEYTSTLAGGVNQHLASIADSQRNTVDLYLQERATNVRGAFVVQRLLRPEPASAVMAELLSELRVENPAFVDVGLFAPEGSLVVFPGPHASLQGRSYGITIAPCSYSVPAASRMGSRKSLT